jgi:cytoskeleton protein RodZ
MVRANEGMSLGEVLRAQRLAAAGSLDEMARATRISQQYLRALETEDFSQLPAPVFVRGFIRAYCSFLGAPADRALALYQETLGLPPAEPHPVFTPRRAPWLAHPIAVSAILLVIFGAGLVALNLAVRNSVKPATPVVVATAASSSEGPATSPITRAPVAATGPLAPEPSPAVPALVAPVREAEAATQRLVVKAVEPTWVRVQTDDGRVAEELLTAGTTREWTSGKRFLLTVGNAGGVEIELNGRPLPSLGARGVVIRRLSLPESAAGS